MTGCPAVAGFDVPGRDRHDAALFTTTRQAGQGPFMIPITRSISLDEREIEETFIRASGPGGQHVNKTSSAVQLRFDVRRSRSLPEEVAARLEELAGHRLTQDGVIIITAETHRSQRLNREEALARLVELIRSATVRKKARRPTRPTRASKERRLDSKARRSSVKAGRRGGRPED